MNIWGDECQGMIRTALLTLDLPRSEAAVRLLCMTAAHESGQYRYSRQITGPAMGLFQMEPNTFYDVMKYINGRPDRFHVFLVDQHIKPEAMVFDFVFATAIARIFYLRIPKALPDPDDLRGLADYAKQYWNTALGKATADDYYEAYIRDYG